jgi:flagella basal body P-ring formation protein FlgA
MKWLNSNSFPIVELTVLLFLGAIAPGVAAAGSREAKQAAVVRLPMLKHAVARHDVIQADNILWGETRARRAPRNALTDESKLIGKAAQHRLQVGLPILASDVSELLAIRKGDLVPIVYTTPHMTLTARGRAMQDATAGAAIRTLNNHSKRMVDATAIAPGIVATQQFSHRELAEVMR